jgi:hypothetical protein
MKIIKARQLIKHSQTPQYNKGRSSRESRTVQISLSGKWLEAIGFQPGQPVFVNVMGDTVTLSPHSPQLVQLPPLETIKAEFQRLGIPTTRTR